jgi:hypothetical protein
MGNLKHAWIGLWVLAGLIVTGINGAALLSLLDEPLAGYSSQVRRAARAFRQYQQLLEAEKKKMASGLDLLAGLFEAETDEKPPEAAAPQPIAPKPVRKKPPQPVVLPVLTGVVTRTSENGTRQWLALMDGRVRTRGDRIRQLTVRKIDGRGVVLAKGSRTWFVKAPEIAYSRTLQ